MPYMALYRKKRPQSFKDVVGQDHIVTTLVNQIKTNRIAHAYLFCGSRGTGKTSTAKIFAKTVNCEDSIDGYPCGQCSQCNLMEEGRSMNIIEIDAASNNGVDNIREIREEVRYSPTEGKYKVYIIDEVHMLSTGAFNALLKTLEEPPSYIIFILATTDPQKIPPTILSRCQRFDFRRISVETIATQLKEYMAEEKIDIEDKAIHYIARLAEGSMRDALSILDQCISFNYGKEITLEKILEILGAVDTDTLFEFASILDQQKSLEAMELIDDIVMRGRDISQFVTDFIVHLRNLLIVSGTNNPEHILDITLEHIHLLKKQIKEIDGSNILRWIRIFSELSNELKYTDQKRIVLEVSVMKICQPRMDESGDALLSRIKQLEEKLARRIRVETIEKTTSKTSISEKGKAIPKKPKAVSRDIKNGIVLWNDIKLGFDQIINGLLIDTKAGYLEDDIYYIVFKDSFIKEAAEKKHKNEIKKKIEETLQKEINIKFISVAEYEKKYKEIYGESPELSEETGEIEEIIEFLKDQEVPLEIK
ncbi:MAG: DNA polymerase III subunit gamma/tau [Epulopiscium sp.]|nr:DNA polymerase III subunit gamma/tau [Candidatus Epulonipiscium sp.]